MVVYAARLGASSYQIGLLTAGPAIIQLLLSLPVGRLLEKLPVIRATYVSAFLQRSGYVFLVFLPWLPQDSLEIWLIILIVLVGSIPGTFLMIGFNALLADLVPVSLRGKVVGRRNALLAISLSVSTLVSGYLLDSIPMPLNYQLVFGIGAVGAMMSTYQLTRLRKPGSPPERVFRPLGEIARPGAPTLSPYAMAASGLRYLTRGGGKSLLHLDLLRTSFGVMMAAYLAFYTAQYLGIPLYPGFMVNILALKDSQISLGYVFFYLTMFFGSLIVNGMSKKIGHRGVLVTGALLFSVYPLLFAIAQGPGYYYLASILGGGVWAFVSAGLINRLMEKTPSDERPAGMALHNLTMNSGILIGSLAGPGLGEMMGPRPAMWVATLARLAAGLIIWRWG
jgi:MFS family permease